MPTLKIKETASTIKISLKEQAILLGGILIALYAIELVDLLIRIFSDASLDNLGIRPRSFWGLLGIPLAPLLHGGFGHLVANTFPFAVLGWLVMLSGKKVFFSATATIAVAGGLGVWIFGSNTIHIGASGVIYGYLGFVLVRAFLEKKIQWIVIAVVAGLIYSGMILSLLNVFKEGISWSSHFFGLAAGALAAFITYRTEDQSGAVSTESTKTGKSRRPADPDDDAVDVDALLEEFRAKHGDGSGKSD